MDTLKKFLLCLIGLLLLLTVISCGYRWKHDYKPPSALRGDLEECQRDVRKFRRGYTGGEDPYQEQIEINNCMRNKGWYR